jgi:hypothetical protein
MSKIRKKDPQNDLRGVLVKLFQGFIYRDDQRYWSQLMLRSEAVRAYFDQIGMYLYIDEADGYAFLRSVPPSDGLDASREDGSSVESEVESVSGDEDGSLRIARKFPLAFDVSLLCVLLRDALEQFDEKVSDDHRLILKREEIYDSLREFFTDVTDETKTRRRFDSMISKVEDLGFLKALKTDAHKFEVRRPIKALIDAEKVSEMKLSMRRFVENSEKGTLHAN